MADSKLTALETAARAYATALSVLSDVQGWTEPVTIAGLHVEWVSGRSTNGYELIRHRVQGLIQGILPDLIVQAIAECRHDVDVKYQALLTAQKEAGVER